LSSAERRDPLDRHPPAYDLEAAAAGDPAVRTREHLERCEACARYVSDLERNAKAYREVHDAQAFATRVAERARPRPPREWTRIARIAAPLAAAAAVLVLVQRRPTPRNPQHEPPTVAPDVHFKGDLAVAVVRERAGSQERIVGPFRVRPGDRIRVEVSTDHARPLSAGILSDDGEWISLLAPALVGAGTHESEQAARVDDTATRGTLLVGTPEAVARARQTGQRSGVIAWRIEDETR
jgi:hypothetical protein